MAASLTRVQLLLLGALSLWCSNAWLSAALSALEEGGTSPSSLPRERVDTAAPAAAGAAAAAAVGDDHSEWHLRHLDAAAAAAAAAAGYRLEVPDWSNGIYDTIAAEPEPGSAAASEESNKNLEYVRVEFSPPFPPTRPWIPAYFSGYGASHPMGPLLLACTVRPNGRAVCDVVPNRPYTPAPGTTLYRAWGMWGDPHTGRAFVSVLGGAPLSAPMGSSSGTMEVPQFCCEHYNNARGCIACTGLPTAAYDPLKVDGGVPRGPQGASEKQGQETPEEKETDTQPERRRRWPQAAQFQPVSPHELFTLLPNLKAQLGPDADPENLSCTAKDPPPQGVPSLGDILRSRTDLTLFESMLERSHVQQLVPCPLTFFAVTDDKARDFQGRRPPPCLSAALARPENQRDILKLVGRLAVLGKLETLTPGTTVPVLYGNPGRTGRRRQDTTWNNIELSKESIVFDRGVIHMLSRNDLNDAESRELLRRILYWNCLHDHLVQHPALTRFALLMVDNRRALPIIGMPPGPRPEWVARDLAGWFAPPARSNQHAASEGSEEANDGETGGCPAAAAAKEAAAKEAAGEKEKEAKAAAAEEESKRADVGAAAAKETEPAAGSPAAAATEEAQGEVKGSEEEKEAVAAAAEPVERPQETAAAAAREERGEAAAEEPAAANAVTPAAEAAAQTAETTPEQKEYEFEEAAAAAAAAPAAEDK